MNAIEWFKIYINAIQILAIALLVIPMVYKSIVIKRPMYLITVPGSLKRGSRIVWNLLFRMYKITVTVWFASTIIGLLAMIYFYLMNIFTLKHLLKENKGHKIYHPYKQYKAYYHILYNDKEEANTTYRYFSFGFWLLIPFFLNSDSMLFGYLGSTIFYQLWSTLLIMKVIYSLRPVSAGISQYVPFLLQVLSLNGLGPILVAYNAIRYSK